MDSWGRFEETNLPPASSFYSKLNMSGVSDQDYEHACKVWRDFGIRNLGEYHDLYLRTDVILLVNVFESFRKVCLDNYWIGSSPLLYSPRIVMESLFKENRYKIRSTTGY